jgi:hypothetical protein
MLLENIEPFTYSAELGIARDPKRGQEQPRNYQRRTPQCLCDEAHFFRDCPYVRPSGWTRKLDIQSRFDKTKKKDSALGKTMARAVKASKSKIAKESDETTSATNATSETKGGAKRFDANPSAQGSQVMALMVQENQGSIN